MIDYPFSWETREKIILAETLFHINNNADYNNFREFLEAELLRLDRLNRKELNIQAINQRQGACQVIDALLFMINNADEMYKVLKGSDEQSSWDK